MLILCYHELARQEGAPGEGSPWILDPDLFEQHLKLLRDRGYEFITLDQIIRPETLPTSDKLCAITFDDGRIGSLTAGLPILKRYGVQATYYICTNFIDGHGVPSYERYSKHMTWGEVLSLRVEGHVVGAHTVSHPYLPHLEQERVVIEIEQGKKILEGKLGEPCVHFAAPFGAMDREIAELCRNAGYLSAVTTNPKPNSRTSDLFLLGRVSFEAPPFGEPLEEIIRKYEADEVGEAGPAAQ